MEPASAQLSAAIYSLIAALLGRRHDGPFLLWCVYNLSFARWGLEGAIFVKSPCSSSVGRAIDFAHRLHPVLLAPNRMCCMYSR